MTWQDAVILVTLWVLVAVVAHLAHLAITWYDSYVGLEHAESKDETLDEFYVFDPGDEQPQH